MFLTDGIYSDQASDIRIATESAIGERLLKQEGARHGYMEEEGHNKQNKEKKLTKGHLSEGKAQSKALLMYSSVFVPFTVL